MLYKTILFLCRFYSDSETWAVDKQFLWGAHLLITPVLDPVSEHIHTHTSSCMTSSGPMQMTSSGTNTRKMGLFSHSFHFHRLLFSLSNEFVDLIMKKLELNIDRGHVKMGDELFEQALCILSRI